jgi:superfamily II DNA or RNA helicase
LTTYDTTLPAGAERSRALPAWPTTRPLRAWQRAAAEAVFAHGTGSFLASATPAAGKTTFGLHVAYRMLAEGRVARVAVVAPTTHICRQWAADAARYGIDLEPNRPNAAGPEPRDRHGVAVTYATLAAGPAVHRRRCAEAATLLIADEPHHMGEQAAWGRSTLDAFAGARFRLLLSGTPFRSDNTPIPWVAYDDEGVSRADYAYGYTDALLERVCRPVTFHTYDGEMEWMSEGRKRRADFGVVLPAAEAARRLRTALDPDGDWISHVLRDAHEQLVELRAGDHPEAGGLVIAADKEHAERLADRLARITGDRPEVVTSDAPDASQRIGRFAAGSGAWLVSVLMVSEGVDVPRLRVGVYATGARTELFFRQVIGRFIRRTPAPKEQMSHVFLPSDPTLKRLAAEIEEERNHALALEPAGDAVAERAERGEASEGFHALWSSARRDDDVLRTTLPGEAMQLFAESAPAAAPAPSPSFAAFGGPITSQTTTTTTSGSAPSRPAGETAYERRERLREQRRTLVAALARRTGEEHRAINARLNRDTNAPSVAKATVDQLERANTLLEKEIARRGA